MSEWVDCAEAARRIRTALKAKGWSCRKVSVRIDRFSMGSAIVVRILDATIPKAMVEAVANEFESVRRDAFGEILGGGNRYVDVYGGC
jgi:hypothetical protein